MLSRRRQEQTPPTWYQRYLCSPEWIRRRARALQLAKWRCQECWARSSKEAPLEVHHLTYERLGAELDVDLIVLCPTCHHRAHYGARTMTPTNPDPIGVYTAMVYSVLEQGRFGNTPDLVEAVAAACRRNHVKAISERIQTAIVRVEAAKKVFVFSPERRFEVVPPREFFTTIGREEAVAILQRLGAKPIKPMPPTSPLLAMTDDKVRALRIVMQEIREHAVRCNRLEDEVIKGIA
ncbi:MAG TPA: HNH endonuclease signature motif containing protein [Vicinamibacterales bacterium]|nr:HNH endonuclease signature motif containing protein [Vicinamibacterales bacterium]